MLEKDMPIDVLRSVGLVQAKKLKALGITTIEDLLWFLPRDYIDLTLPQPINRVQIGKAAIRAKVIKISVGRTATRHLLVVTARLADESGEIDAVWYSQPWIRNQLTVGDERIFYGLVGWGGRRKLVLNSPRIYFSGSIVPIYRLTRGINSRLIANLVEQALLNLAPLPDLLRDYFPNLGLEQVFKQVHQPISPAEAVMAASRLATTELSLYLLDVRLASAHNQRQTARQFKIPIKELKKLVVSLPFTLTNDQRKTAWTIINDLALKRPMNRLLQGDVGSGKTIVGALAAYTIALSKYQTIWLAPTQILAHQHTASLKKILEPFKISIAQWTSSVKENSHADIIVGTHAILTKSVDLGRVGLIIIDEQHRFGVEQRTALLERQPAPHLLAMTATPIPRTLALTVFGDQKQSRIDELPAGRLPVETRLLSPRQHEPAYQTIRQQISLGHQVYIVVPLVENNNEDELFSEKKAALDEYQRLSRQVFPQFRVGLIHGRLSSAQKQAAMKSFKAGRTNILISTTVVEVGVDVPNATVMLVENAECFGLATLHQLRGRVGRANTQSYCYLIPSQWNEKIATRLLAMERHSSGFELAEIDLQLRGPGDLTGLRQAGLPDFRVARLADKDEIKLADQIASAIIKKGQIGYALKNELKHWRRIWLDAGNETNQK